MGCMSEEKLTINKAQALQIIALESGLAREWIEDGNWCGDGHLTNADDISEVTLITAATYVVEQTAVEMHHLIIGPKRIIAKEERDQDERFISFCKVGPYYCWYSASFSWVGLFESFNESRESALNLHSDIIEKEGSFEPDMVQGLIGKTSGGR
jgi:hypothetical protein